MISDKPPKIEKIQGNIQKILIISPNYRIKSPNVTNFNKNWKKNLGQKRLKLSIFFFWWNFLRLLFVNTVIKSYLSLMKTSFHPRCHIASDAYAFESIYKRLHRLRHSKLEKLLIRYVRKAKWSKFWWKQTSRPHFHVR